MFRPLTRHAAESVVLPGSLDADAGSVFSRVHTTSRVSTRVLVLGAVLAAYIAGAATLAWTRMPQTDEGHFANAGYELAYHGRLAMPMWTEWVPTIDRHMYAQMPLYHVQIAPWVMAFGYDLRAVRMNSVFWGAIFVLAWFVIVRHVSQSDTTALLGAALIGLNYDLMNLTSARYDPMAAALSAAGVAFYLSWRERHLERALLAAHACIAAALLTHPFGLFGLLGFGIFFLFLDIRRLSPRVIAAALAPYVVFFGAYGLYVLQDPADFKRQLATNVQGRLVEPTHPWQLFVSEIRERYLERYAGWRADVPPLMRIKVLFLVGYVAAIVACLVTPSLRRSARVMALVTWAVAAFVVLALMDSNHWYVYLLHVLPIFTAVMAVWFGSLFARGGVLRLAVVSATAASILFAAGTVVLRARLNDYGRLYLPTLAYLQQHVKPGQLVTSGGEFGPGLGFSEHVLDDTHFGFKNGRTPDWIVYDKLHEERMAGWAKTDPALYQYIEKTLNSYELVLDNRQPYNYYRVYRRPGA